MGRPAGSKNKTTTTKKKVTPKYTCMCCSKEKSEKEFYKSQSTRLWNYSNRKVLFCRDCIDSLMREFTDRYGEQNALIICCYILDIPYFPEAYQSVITSNNFFGLGMYIRLLNGPQYRGKSFLNSIIDGQLNKTEEEIREVKETKWSKTDKQNMNYAMSVVGYDPFIDSSMTDIDRKYCFNILAGYCDTDGIKEDGHKIQSVIEISQLHLQCKKLNEMINSEQLRDCPDEKKMKTLSETKTKFLEAISTIAKDNNITSKYNGTSRQGKNTLSEKMKEMATDGYKPIKVNLFDITTCEAMKQVADLSNQSILEQLTLDANDYTEIIKDQREIITSTQDELESIKEENRIVKNKLALLEQAEK